MVKNNVSSGTGVVLADVETLMSHLAALALLPIVLWKVACGEVLFISAIDGNKLKGIFIPTSIGQGTSKL